MASTRPQLRIKRIALNGRAPSRRLLLACCRFGIGVSRERAPALGGETPDVLRALVPRAVAFVTGPSGSGKSRLLGQLRALRRARYVDLAADRAGSRGSAASVIDRIALPLDRALRLLSAVGLADPLVLGRTPSELSVGERARFMLARALARPPAWLLIDEFLTTLDRATAWGVARSFRRAAGEYAPETRIVVATAHEDVAQHLNADVVVRLAGPGAEARSKAPVRAKASRQHRDETGGGARNSEFGTRNLERRMRRAEGGARMPRSET